jgi:hypothetical protein
MEQPLVALGLHERLVTTGMQATLDAEAQLRVEIAKVDLDAETGQGVTLGMRSC